MTVSLDTENRLYVIKHGDGFSCLGFDVVFRRSSAIARWLGMLPPNQDLVGTLEGYAEYERLLQLGHNYHRRTGGRQCLAELHPQLKGLEGKRVKVVKQNGEQRVFIVGRSTGWMPIHLECEPGDVGGLPLIFHDEPYLSVEVVTRATKR